MNIVIRFLGPMYSVLHYCLLSSDKKIKLLESLTLNYSSIVGYRIRIETKCSPNHAFLLLQYNHVVVSSGYQIIRHAIYFCRRVI